MNINKLLKVNLFTLTVATFSSYSLFAQKLESSVSNGSLSSEQANTRIAKVFGEYDIPSPQTNIMLTKIVNTSMDKDGKRVSLSGLMAVPPGDTDRRDPLVAAVINDNVFDWAPKTSMLLINLEGDGVVTPKNTANAMNAMRKRGVTATTLRRLMIRDSNLTHLNVIPAAMSKARAFFDEGFSGVREAQ